MWICKLPISELALRMKESRKGSDFVLAENEKWFPKWASITRSASHWRIVSFTCTINTQRTTEEGSAKLQHLPIKTKERNNCSFSHLFWWRTPEEDTRSPNSACLWITPSSRPYSPQWCDEGSWKCSYHRQSLLASLVSAYLLMTSLSLFYSSSSKLCSQDRLRRRKTTSQAESSPVQASLFRDSPSLFPLSNTMVCE